MPCRATNAGVLLDVSAFITGGGSGIGKATAELLARHGAAVAVMDIDGDAAEQTATAINELGGRALALQGDVAVWKDVAAAVDTAADQHGPPLVAFNNAGIVGPYTDLLNHSDAEYDRVMSVNVRGVWLCMKAELPGMLKAGGGAIVNMASALGLIGTRNQPAYISSKHAIVGLTRAAAIDYASAGVRINCVCPGVVSTPALRTRVRDSDPELEPLLRAHPIGRFGEPDEIAEAVLWLCSPWASYVTGTTLTVDGGFTA